eukprot:1081731-Prymnesium_polylepis.1
MSEAVLEAGLTHVSLVEYLDTGAQAHYAERPCCRPRAAPAGRCGRDARHRPTGCLCASMSARGAWRSFMSFTIRVAA